MSKNWNPNGGFPSAEQVERMVAAEVKHLAESEYAREHGIEEKRESRRDRLRAAYRLQHQQVGARSTSTPSTPWWATWRRLRSPRGEVYSRSTWLPLPTLGAARTLTTLSSS